MKKKKEKKRQYYRECNKILLEKQMQNLAEYMGNYYLVLKK